MPSLPVLVGQVLLALAILAVSITFMTNWFGSSGGKRSRSGPPTVVLAGASNAGKTTLFHCWQTEGDIPATVTSTSINESTGFALNPAYRLVDCPGNDRLQSLVKHELQNGNPKAVVFMVDATDTPENIKQAGLQLYPVLEPAERDSVPVLIAVNKADMFSALSKSKIQKLLEEEIHQLRDTKSNSLLGTNEKSDDDKEYLGLADKQFAFEDLITIVDVIEGSAKLKNVEKWERWLTQFV